MSWLKETLRAIAERKKESEKLRGEAALVARRERQEALAKWEPHESVVISLIRKWQELEVDRILRDVQRDFWSSSKMNFPTVWFKEINGDHLMCLEWQRNEWRATWHQPSARHYMPDTASATGTVVKEALSKSKYKPEEIEFSCMKRGLFYVESTLKDKGESFEATSCTEVLFTIAMNRKEIICQTAFGEEEVLASLEEIKSPKNLEERIDHFLARKV